LALIDLVRHGEFSSAAYALISTAAVHPELELKPAFFTSAGAVIA
jgi:hypothetical protein